MKFDIIHGANRGRTKAVSPAVLENMYVELHPGGDVSNVKSLVSCPGFRDAGAMHTSGYGRGMYRTTTNRLFAVVGNKLMEISMSEVVTERGTLSTSLSHCRMVDNGLQVLILDGYAGYIYTLSTDVLSTITDTDFPNTATHPVFNNGYFLVNAPGTGRFYFSGSYDGTTWSALEYATAEFSADDLTAITSTSNGTVYLLGVETVELWSGVADPALPWRRISGTVKAVGTVAPFSVATDGTSVFFLGGGAYGYGSVFMSVGYEFQRVSTPAIEFGIKSLSNQESATAFTYSDETHNFYVLSFGDEITYVYDSTSQRWHTRGTFNSSAGLVKRQYANGYAFFNNKHYVCSYLNPNLYEMNLNLYSDAGGTIRRRIVTGRLANENKRIRHHELEIDLERGVGNSGEDDPVLMMRFSDDGGNTWSAERRGTPGGIGEYRTRLHFHQLGMSRNRVYEFIMTDSVQWEIVNCFVEAS